MQIRFIENNMLEVTNEDGEVFFVPDDMSNRDRYEIWNEWEMQPAPSGTPDDQRVRQNTITAYSEPVHITLDRYKSALDSYMDSVALARVYDNRFTISTYTSSTNPQWRQEAEEFVAWRDEALAKTYELLNQFGNGEGTPPTVEEFLNQLPNPPWPPIGDEPAAEE
jgi:hypothetical protein